MKRKLMFGVLMLVLVMSVAFAGCSKDSSKLVIGTSADYPPFESVDDDGKFVGFDIALMEEAAKRMGVEIEWQDIAFDGLIGALQSDKIDAVIAAMSATPDREEQVDFTMTYYSSADAIIVLEDSDMVIEANEDMAGYKVGVQAGTIQEEWIDENIDVELSRYERAEQAIMDLKAGRIDVVAMDYNAALAFIEEGGVKLALETEFAGEHMAIAVKEGNKDLLDKFNEAIAELQDEGFVDDLAREYLAGE